MTMNTICASWTCRILFQSINQQLFIRSKNKKTFANSERFKSVAKAIDLAKNLTTR